MIIKPSLNYCLMKFNQIIKHLEIKCLLAKVTSGCMYCAFLTVLRVVTYQALNKYIQTNKLILVLSLH